jgi:hypothetical protein
MLAIKLRTEVFNAFGGGNVSFDTLNISFHTLSLLLLSFGDTFVHVRLVFTDTTRTFLALVYVRKRRCGRTCYIHVQLREPL